MKKEDITRTNLSNSSNRLLKRVIIRIDFKGLIKVDDFINNNQNWLKEKFENMNITSADNLGIDFEDLNFETVSRVLSISLKEIEEQTFYHFTDNTFDDNLINLYVSKYTVIIDIECKKYLAIDSYANLIEEITEKMKDTNTFMIIKRISIRKIASNLFKDKKSLFDIFEKKYFGFDKNQSDLEIDKFDRLDTLYNKEHDIVIKFRRKVSTGIIKDIETGKEYNGYLAIADIEGFSDSPKDTQVSAQLKSINDFLFSIFKDAVTDSYLNNQVTNG